MAMSADDALERLAALIKMAKELLESMAQAIRDGDVAKFRIDAVLRGEPVPPIPSKSAPSAPTVAPKTGADPHTFNSTKGPPAKIGSPLAQALSQIGQRIGGSPCPNNLTGRGPNPKPAGSSIATPDRNPLYDGLQRAWTSG